MEQNLNNEKTVNELSTECQRLATEAFDPIYKGEEFKTCIVVLNTLRVKQMQGLKQLPELKDATSAEVSVAEFLNHLGGEDTWNAMSSEQKDTLASGLMKLVNNFIKNENTIAEEDFLRVTNRELEVEIKTQVDKFLEKKTPQEIEDLSDKFVVLANKFSELMKAKGQGEYHKVFKIHHNTKDHVSQILTNIMKAIIIDQVPEDNLFSKVAEIAANNIKV